MNLQIKFVLRRLAIVMVFVGVVTDSTWAGVPGDTYIKQRLATYSDAFPQIKFIHLRGVEDFSQVDDLAYQLGSDARDRVYQHGKEARQLLIEAQLQRIQMMVSNSWPSSTIFATGKDSSFKQPYVCVLTLDPRPFSNNEFYASQMLLGELGQQAEALEPGGKLSNSKFIRFTLEHEVFHCLDAYINGPTIRQTETLLGHCYQLFRSEQRADVFATLAFRQMQPDSDKFLSLLSHYRTASLLDWDTAHFTAFGVLQSIRVSDSEISNLGLRELAKLAGKVSKSVTPRQSEFAGFLASAHSVALARGVEQAAVAPEADELGVVEIDPWQVALLDRSVDIAKNVLFGETKADTNSLSRLGGQ